MIKLVFFGGSGVASSVAMTRTHTKLKKQNKNYLKLGTLILYGATYHGSNFQAGETNSDHSVQQTRIIKNKFSSYFKDQRTNGPVNAHLKPEIYTNKLV